MLSHLTVFVLLLHISHSFAHTPFTFLPLVSSWFLFILFFSDDDGHCPIYRFHTGIFPRPASVQLLSTLHDVLPRSFAHSTVIQLCVSVG
jgi:hypothetical protein